MALPLEKGRTIDSDNDSREGHVRAVGSGNPGKKQSRLGTVEDGGGTRKSKVADPARRPRMMWGTRKGQDSEETRESMAQRMTMMAPNHFLDGVGINGFRELPTRLLNVERF